MKVIFSHLYLVEGSTHLGSMSHASTVLSLITHLKADDSTLKAGLDLDGINRNVGRFKWQTSSKVGRVTDG